MDSLNRYRKRVLGNPETATAPFIEKALNKIAIKKYEGGEVLGEAMDAVLIFRDVEGPDSAKLYTYAKDGLNVGDCFVKKGARDENDVYFLITEEVKRVDTSEKIRVFNTLETNVNIIKKDTVLPAYFMSNLRSKIRAAGRMGVDIETKESVLVAPIGYKIKLDEILNIKNMSSDYEPQVSWQVYGIDDLSSPTVAYHHLTQVLKAKEEEIINDPAADGNIKRGDTLSLRTERGFIRTEPAATVINREASKILIQVPDTDILVVTVMEEGELKEKVYEVRK